MWWIQSLNPPCKIEDQVEISGVFLGFSKNDSYWDIMIDNKTYLFKNFGENYMENLIGFDIIINACHRYNSRTDLEYYDLESAYVKN